MIVRLLNKWKEDFLSLKYRLGLSKENTVNYSFIARMLQNTSCRRKEERRAGGGVARWQDQEE